MIDYFVHSDGTRYNRLVSSGDSVRVTVAWDDQNPDYSYKSRTEQPDWGELASPPAVYRYYPEAREKSGDYRVNLSSPDWKQSIVNLNGGGVDGLHRWEYLTLDDKAMYNTTGWPQQAYLTMSGNTLLGRFIGDWFLFETLKPSDLSRVGEWTINSHPEFIHRFTCVGWDNATKTTKRIESSNTSRGQVYFYLVTNEGFGYIPKRHVVRT